MSFVSLGRDKVKCCTIKQEEIKDTSFVTDWYKATEDALLKLATFAATIPCDDARIEIAALLESNKKNLDDYDRNPDEEDALFKYAMENVAITARYDALMLRLTGTNKQSAQ